MTMIQETPPTKCGSESAMALQLVRPILRHCKYPWRPLITRTSGQASGIKLQHCQQPRKALHSDGKEQRMEVEKLGSCVVVHLNFGENRLTSAFLKAFHEALDKAEGYEDAKAVVTIGEGKHYCLGLDLEGMARMNWPETQQHFSDIQNLQARLLTFPLVTVAAINGHIYAGGAFLAFAQDYTIMRKDRGWFCLPEINLRKNFPAAWVEFAKARLPVTEHKLAIVLGKRYTGEEAKTAGIVNEVSPMEELKDSAIAAANRLAGDGLDRKTLATLKYDLHRDVYRALNEPVRFYSML